MHSFFWYLREKKENKTETLKCVDDSAIAKWYRTNEKNKHLLTATALYKYVENKRFQ